MAAHPSDIILASVAKLALRMYVNAKSGTFHASEVQADPIKTDPRYKNSIAEKN